MFIRRSLEIVNEFWRTPSESQRTDQNSSFFGALDVRDGMCDWALLSRPRSPYAGSMRDQRRGRWPSIEPAYRERAVFTGLWCVIINTILAYLP